ncbi:hypothetical protein I5H08_gp058 [Mycobacterium phage Yuna]|uniref:Uncharacterized protein n=1 Tax=Mycobacterium phage Yuna TaxID=2599885 RepID=A0A5J6TI70_9CAUD|nr:hypothetical protein I5H08_gp058 [Mycobacterium phage Yuna]QFG09429.1 hypothetical protein PBI_YUNA_47 [Mycobacterium phage Yuna]
MRRRLSPAQDMFTHVMAQVDREPVEVSIEKWRSAGRHYAKQAQEMLLDLDEAAPEGDERLKGMIEVTATASLAQMYFAMAHDVHCFGKLPPAQAPDE